MAASTFNIGVVIGAAIGKSYFSAFDSASKKAKKLSTEINAIGATQKNIKRFKELNSSIGDTAKAMGDASNKTGDLKKQIVNSEAVIKKLRAEAEATGGSVQKMLTWPKFNGQRMSKYMKELGGHGPAIKKIAAEWKVYKAEFKGATGSTNKATEALNKEEEALNKLQAALKKSVKDSERLKKAEADQRNELRDLSTAMRKAGVDTANLRREEQRLNVQLAKVQKRLDHMGKASLYGERMKDLKSRAIGAAASIASLGVTVNAAFDVEKKGLQLGDVIVGKDVKQRLAASMKHAREFAQVSLSSETEVLEIDYSLRSSGLGDAAARFGSEIVAKVATITNGDVSDVGFIIGDTFKNMGASMSGTVEEKLVRIGDVFTKTKSLFSIKDFTQFGEGIKNAMPAALANKLTLEQTAALIGQINNGMLKGAEAGTGFKAIMRQLPTAQKTLGFTIKRDKNGAVDIIATLERIKVATDRITNADEKAIKMQAAFADEGTAALLPLINNLDDLKKNYQIVTEAAEESVNEGYQRRLDAASGKWTMLSQNVIILGAAFGTTLLPALTNVFGFMGDIAIASSDLITQFPVIGEAIGALVVGFGAFATAIIGLTAVQWAWNVAMAANPLIRTVSLVVAGAALLAAAVYPIYKNWDKLVVWFNAEMGLLAGNFSWLTDFFGGGENKTIKGHVSIDPVAPPSDLPRIKSLAANKQKNTVVTDQSNTTITIYQQAGEDGEALATRTAALLAQARDLQQQAAMYDVPEAVL